MSCDRSWLLQVDLDSKRALYHEASGSDVWRTCCGVDLPASCAWRRSSPVCSGPRQARRRRRRSRRPRSCWSSRRAVRRSERCSCSACGEVWRRFRLYIPRSLGHEVSVELFQAQDFTDWITRSSFSSSPKSFPAALKRKGIIEFRCWKASKRHASSRF